MGIMLYNKCFQNFCSKSQAKGKHSPSDVEIAKGMLGQVEHVAQIADRGKKDWKQWLGV